MCKWKVSMCKLMVCAHALQRIATHCTLKTINLHIDTFHLHIDALNLHFDRQLSNCLMTHANSYDRLATNWDQLPIVDNYCQVLAIIAKQLAIVAN